MSELHDRVKEFLTGRTATRGYMSDQEVSDIRDLLAENERLASDVAERDRLLAERDRLLTEEDRLHSNTIHHRDRAEEVIDRLCDAVLGLAPEHRPEWSNVYGFDDAVTDVEERMARAEAAESRLRELCKMKPAYWTLTRRRDGFIRGCYPTKPTHEQLQIAVLDGDQYTALIPRPTMEDFK